MPRPPSSFAYGDSLSMLQASQEVGFRSPDPEAAFDSAVQTVRRAGLNPGEVVLLVAPQGRAMVAAFFGLLEAGVVPAIHPLARRDRVQAVAQALGSCAIVWLSGEGPCPQMRCEKLTPPVVARHTAGDVILLTSGTSGVASGCLHSFESLLDNAAMHSASVGLGSRDRTLVTLPLHYSFALVAQVLGAIHTGGSLAIASAPFSTPAFASALAETEATVTSLTPWLVGELLRTGWQAPSTLRLLTVGGAELPLALAQDLRVRCGSSELALTYGLSEAGPRVSTLRTRGQPDRRLSSVGPPLPGVTAELRRVVDGVGELMVTTPTAMKQLVGRVDSRTDVPRRDGQVATGDLFTIDAEGFLHFRGRLKDVILHRGTKLHLGSIRRVVEESPLVAYTRTRVLGAGYSLEVFVQQGSSATEHEVRRDAMSRLSFKERPTSLRVEVAVSAHK